MMKAGEISHEVCIITIVELLMDSMRDIIDVINKWMFICWRMVLLLGEYEKKKTERD